MQIKIKMFYVHIFLHFIERGLSGPVLLGNKEEMLKNRFFSLRKSIRFEIEIHFI